MVKPIQYCKVINLQLNKFILKKIKKLFKVAKLVNDGTKTKSKTNELFFSKPLVCPRNSLSYLYTLLRLIAWKIPPTEEPGRLQSMGSQRVRLGWTPTCAHVRTHTRTHTHRLSHSRLALLPFSRFCISSTVYLQSQIRPTTR